jgi:hypothetical protein
MFYCASLQDFFPNIPRECSPPLSGLWAISALFQVATITMYEDNILSKTKIILATIMGKYYTCPACQKVCKSVYGLQQHIQSSKLCKDTSNTLSFLENKPDHDDNAENLADLDKNDGTNTSPKKRQLLDTFDALLENDHLARQKLFDQHLKNEEEEEEEKQAVEEMRAQVQQYHDGDFWFDPFVGSSSSSSEDGGGYQVDGDEDDDEMQGNPVQVVSDESIKQFRAFV